MEKSIEGFNNERKQNNVEIMKKQVKEISKKIFDMFDESCEGAFDTEIITIADSIKDNIDSITINDMNADDSGRLNELVPVVEKINELLKISKELGSELALDIFVGCAKTAGYSSVFKGLHKFTYDDTKKWISWTPEDQDKADALNALTKEEIKKIKSLEKNKFLK